MEWGVLEPTYPFLDPRHRALNMGLSPGARNVLRLVLSYVAVSYGFSLIGPSYITWLAPTIAWAIEHATSEVVVRSVFVQAQTLQVTFAQVSAVGGGEGPDVTAGGPIQVLYGAPVIALSLLAAWPAKPLAQKSVAGFIALLPLAGLPMLTFPTLMLAPMFAEQAANGLFWFWFFCVANGGPQLAAVLIAWLAITVSGRILGSTPGRSSELTVRDTKPRPLPTAKPTKPRGRRRKDSHKRTTR